jgi:hypothetical protein
MKAENPSIVDGIPLGDVQTDVTPATIVIGDWMYLFYKPAGDVQIKYTKCRKAEVYDPSKWTEGKRISEEVSTRVAPSALWVESGKDVRMVYLVWVSDKDHRIWAARSRVSDASDLFHAPWYHTPFPEQASSLNGPGAFFVRDKTNPKSDALQVAYTTITGYSNDVGSFRFISLAKLASNAEWTPLDIDK